MISRKGEKTTMLETILIVTMSPFAALCLYLVRRISIEG